MARQIGIAMQRFGPKASMLAFALLRDRPATVTEEQVASVFKQVLKRPVKVERIDGHSIIFGFMVSIEPLYFSVTCSAKPYVPPAGIAQFAGQFADEETRKRVAAHTCFVSVEMMDVTPDSIKESMPILSMIAGSFVDEGTTAIVSTFFQSAVPTTAQTVRDFQTGNILGRLAHAAEADQRRNIQSERSAMREAIEEARRRVPEFLAAWESSGGDGTFMIKSAFKENDITEHMWSTVISIDNGVVVGTLQNQPNYLKKVREGQKHSVSISELSDWCYATKGKGEGSFTDPALREILLSA